MLIIRDKYENVGQLIFLGARVLNDRLRMGREAERVDCVY